MADGAGLVTRVDVAAPSDVDIVLPSAAVAERGGRRRRGRRGSSRGRLLLRMVPGRIGQAILTLWASSVAVWLLSALAPGDPAQQVLSTRGVRSPTAAQLSSVRHELGLDRPLVTQYLHWLTHAVRGDFGTSYISGIPVRTELAHRLGATLTLASVALAMVIAVALMVGLGAAAMVGRWPDIALRGLTVVAAAIPAFVIGLVLIQVVIVNFGIGHVIADGSLGDAILPAICIAVGSLAVPTRVLRASAIAAMEEHYALMARARGARPRWVLLRHALPNSLVPFIHALSLAAAYMIGGTVVVEAVFTWPGVGSYLVTSVAQHDLPVVQAGVLLATLAYVVASLVADVLTALIDPRAELAS